MYCPHCNQGEVVKAMVISTKEIIYICDECDSVWTSYEGVSNATGTIFEFYANAHNLKPLWTELELL